jgi:hypothetical protein
MSPRSMRRVSSSDRGTIGGGAVVAEAAAKYAQTWKEEEKAGGRH